MILSRRILFTLPISSVIHNTSTQKLQKTSVAIPITIPVDTKPDPQIQLNDDIPVTSSTEKLVTISDINDVKFFNHCAKLFELYHDDYKSFNEYKKDQYKKYKLSLLEAYDNSCNMIESEDLKDFIREQGQTFSMENVCNIHECV